MPDAVLDALRAAAARGAWVLSVCSGAFALGAAGLLDGRRCTTHWMYAQRLAECHPLARSIPMSSTSRTTASSPARGRPPVSAHGRPTAPHRDGGQAQFVEAPLPAGADTLAPLLAWMQVHLDQPLAVAELARRAHLSERNFARRFRNETGTTPAAWTNRQRVLRAQDLLERTDLSVEEITGRCGFGAAAGLRHHFDRVLGTSPVAYRRTFAGRAGEAGAAAPRRGAS